MNTNETNQQVPVGKPIKGSAIYGSDGTYVFSPYAEGKAENQIWLPLATVDNGKLECSKNKVRMVLTMDRTDLPLVNQTFVNAFGKLIAKTTDKTVQKLYKAAANMSPAEVKKGEEAPPQPSPVGRESKEEEVRPFAY